MSDCSKHYMEEDDACPHCEVDKLKLQVEEMKKVLRYIVEPILKADEEKEPDKHAFCRCVYCRAWNLYEDDSIETPKP